MNIITKYNSPNQRTGRNGYKIKGIVFHITADDNCVNVINWLCNPSAQASAHYVIDKDGSIYQLVAPENVAWHAGIVNKTSAKIYTDMGGINPNKYTIGIEVVTAKAPPTSAQYQAILELTNYLCKTYSIPKDRYNLIGHYQLDAVDRPFDPIVSYSVDSLVVDLNRGIKMDYKQILNSKNLSNPQDWIALVEALEQGNLPIDKVGLLKYLKALIEKIGNF